MTEFKRDILNVANLLEKGAIDKRESLLRDTNISLTFSIDQH